MSRQSPLDISKFARLFRSFSSAALAASLLLGCSDAAEPPAEEPPPAAEIPVGTLSFAFTDASRDEDATEAPDDKREILITAFYPAREGGAYPKAPCFRRPGEADLNAVASGLPEGSLDTVCEGEALEGAEMAEGEPLPLLVFSHGYSSPIALYTSWLEALARRGYIVLGVTHPYSAGFTVLSSGAVATTPDPPLEPALFDAFVAKLSLDQRAAVEALRVALPDSPAGHLAARWDQDRVGFLGHSIGGAASARTCLIDEGAGGCVNLDGTMESNTAEQGLDRPFLLANASTSFTQDASRPLTWENLRGPGYRLDLPAALHNNFSDLAFWIDRLDLPVEPAMMQIGAIDPARAEEVTLAFLGAFFDRHVRGLDAPLLDGPSPHPEALWERR
jgi:hypothetical protein